MPQRYLKVMIKVKVVGGLFIWFKGKNAINIRRNNMHLMG
jgi:hypothetical protein